MKIKQQVNELQEIEQLIKLMFNELELSRFIIERYRLMHGDIIQGGKVKIDDSIDFRLVSETSNGNEKIKQIDAVKLGFKKSSFQQIKEKYNELI